MTTTAGISKSSQLWQDALVWDNVWPVDAPGEMPVGNDWSKLDRFQGAGFNVISITLAGDNHNAGQALALTAWARKCVRELGEKVRLVHTIDDIDAARAADALAVIFHFEGTRCFERNLDLVEAFYLLGVRQTLLAFNNNNSAGGGCAEGSDGGLTSYGRRLVAEMERVGMLVDLSHTGARTSLDALAVATKPMVFSHSNARAVHDNFRNLDDEQAKACAATGGLIGVSGASEYLGDPRCSNGKIFEHIDYYVNLVGINHVGLGLDLVFDSYALNTWMRERPDEWPVVNEPGWPGFKYAAVEQIPVLVDIMIDHGYSDQDVRAILGENIRRICSSVWRG